MKWEWSEFDDGGNPQDHLGLKSSVKPFGMAHQDDALDITVVIHATQ
jgi:hypothetical protein